MPRDHSGCRDERAASYAAERDATLAVGRLEARGVSGNPVTLSPAHSAALVDLLDLGVGGLSPEARVAEAAFRAVEPDLVAQLASCASGLELAGLGFAEDVSIASALDVSEVVPVLSDAGFVRAG